MEFDTLQERFVGFLQQKDRSASTITAYSKDIEQLLSYLQDKHTLKDIKAVTTDMLVSYIDELQKNGNYTLKTISRKINSLKTFFKYLFSSNLIVSDVSTPVKHPEFKPQLPRVLSLLEYRALRDTARGNARLYAMVELLLQTGIRIGELSRLKVSQVHLTSTGGTIHVERFSSNPDRTIELNERAREALTQFLKESEANSKGYLFHTKSGNPVLIRNIRAAVHRAFKKAGIKNATVNDIRNTFIVYQLENGVRLEVLAQFVGHQKPTTTERYLQLVEHKSKKQVSKIEPL